MGQSSCGSHAFLAMKQRQRAERALRVVAIRAHPAMAHAKLVQRLVDCFRRCVGCHLLLSQHETRGTKALSYRISMRKASLPGMVSMRPSPINWRTFRLEGSLGPPLQSLSGGRELNTFATDNRVLRILARRVARLSPRISAARFCCPCASSRACEINKRSKCSSARR